jgi:hypothetical protein
MTLIYLKIYLNFRRYMQTIFIFGIGVLLMNDDE